MGDKIPPGRAIAVDVIIQARQFPITSDRYRSTGHSPALTPLNSTPSVPFCSAGVNPGWLIHCGDAGSSRHTRATSPSCGAASLGPAPPARARLSADALQHVPAKARVFTAVGGAFFNPQARLGDLPERPRNVGKNARFGPPFDL